MAGLIVGANVFITTASLPLLDELAATPAAAARH